MILWIDIACLDREDRSGFIARIDQEIQSRWIPMPSEHRHDAIEYRDAFYIALRLAAG